MLDHLFGRGAARHSQAGRAHLTKIMTLVVLLCSLGIALLVVAGSIRYGGFDGFVLRVRAEIASYRPHPSLVPTPIGYDAESVAVILSPTPALSKTTLPSPTPTRPDTPTPGQAPAQPPTATPPPTVTPTPTLTSTPTVTPTPAYRPAREFVELQGLVHMWQTWNNCGPATLAMDLSYFACSIDQADVAAEMRPNREDKNVSPDELAAFARSQGLEALVRVNGSAERLRLLLSNDLPVIVETWVEEEPDDGLGHYRLLTGYDDVAQEWIAYDSLVSAGVEADRPYAGIRLGYDQTARWWAVFNRVYVVIYTSETAPVVRGILGSDYDETAMWQRALQSAEQEVQQSPKDPFAWFNLGTDLVAAGEFERAASAYDQARTIGLPWRMLWYQFGPFSAYYHSGRHEELIALARATIAVTGQVEELHYWLGMGLRATGDAEGAAAEAFRRALSLNGNYVEAAEALAGATAEIGE
ncbi:MAG: C39 family peptidase [Anaerolineae bacterium]|nr:C39 family peptidase [Anaerolineae bacterium]